MDEEKKFYLIMYAGWGLAVFLLWYVLSSGSVRDNGNGVATVGTELTSAQQSATILTERIEKTEQRADTIREGIISVTSIVERTGNEITDCQRIIETVRRRGKIAQTKD